MSDVESNTDTAESIADRLIRAASVVKPGETLVVETMTPLRIEAERRMKDSLARAGKALGIRILVLPFGMRAARVERKPDAQG